MDDRPRNLKAMLAQGLSKFELVSHEEFAVQQALQVRLRARVDALEARVKALEEKAAP